jgi:hypothetical protein
MSKGDNLIGIPTTYKGIQMKSKLETKIAMFLDGLGIKWKYEPTNFLLSNGITYVPDFFLTELQMWLEVKGDIQEHNKQISELFVIENKTELILISNKEAMWFSAKDWVDGFNFDTMVFIGKCRSCDRYFFCSNTGSYHCRGCGNHEGDHDLKSYFQNVMEDEVIDFYDSISIKRGLEKYGVRISTIQ